MQNEETQPEKKQKISFALDFNLGHLFVIFSLFLSAAGLYAHDETRLAIVETQVSSLEGQNLPTRMSADETAIKGLRSDLHTMNSTLSDIYNELVQNHADTVRIYQKVDAKTDANTKALKSKIFP